MNFSNMLARLRCQVEFFILLKTFLFWSKNAGLSLNAFQRGKEYEGPPGLASTGTLDERIVLFYIPNTLAYCRSNVSV